MKTSIVLLISLAVTIPACANAKSKKLDLWYCEKTELKVDDGDSFSCGEETIRILGIDAPEIKHPRHGLHKDQAYGPEAAAFTNNALMKAGRIAIVRGGKDPYGRTLAHVIVDGELLGVRLIKASLAYENISRYGTNGLPEFALQLKEAAKTSMKPEFEDPHEWRKKHKDKK